MWWVVAVVALVALAAWLWRVVRQDGQGHRPPPASHHAWFEQLT